MVALTVFVVVVEGSAVAHANQVPVAAYSFDEGSGPTVKDSAGSNNGTISGATWAPVGKYGSGLNFDGENDLVSITDAVDLDLTSAFTVEAWVRPDSLTAARPVVSKGESTGGNSGYMLSARYGSNPTGLVASSGTTKSVAASSGLPVVPPTWSHLALTSDGINLRLYIGGKLAATAPAIAAKATAAKLEIGHSFLGGFFDGLIDEVRLYDEALSEPQIQVDRDNRVEPAPLREVTTSVLETGPSSELVSSVPIDGATETAVYSLPIPAIKLGEVLRVTANLEVTNTHTYNVTDAVRLVLGSSPTGGSGTVVTPWTRIQQTKDMLHWTLPTSGVYRSSSDTGTVQYLKLVLKASSSSAQPGETLIVEPNFGRLAVTRYTPTVGPMAQPTHQLQSLDDPMPEQITTLPVDSTWRSVLTRKVSDLRLNDILGITGQIEVQNASGTTVQVESKITMTPAPSAVGSTASPVVIDRLNSLMTFNRVVHSNEVLVTDPAKSYFNLSIRAVPMGASPPPLAITKDSAALKVVRMTPNGGVPNTPLGTATLQERGLDFDPNVASIPFAPAGGSQKRVVASAPIYGGVWKDEVIRARGLVTGDLNGAAAQVLTQLIVADSPTDTVGEVVSGLSGDNVPANAQVHTIVKEGQYVVPKAEAVHKYLNFVVYASHPPAFPGESMSVPAASVSFLRSKPTSPLDEGFEDGLDALFQFEYDGVLDTSSAFAREGTKSMLMNLDFSQENPDDPPGIRRVEATSPDVWTSGGYYGEESWYGFSAYFPADFNIPATEPPSFDGLIDEVRLYDQALTSAQIVADRNGNYGTGPAPVAAYSFNNGSGATAFDSTGQHNGTISGATWTAGGKYGSALSFDGFGDEVVVPDASELDFTDSFTVEAWASPNELASLIPIINKSTNFSGYVLAPGYNPDKPAGLAGGSEGIASVVGSKALPTGTWAHLAFTSDGDNLSLYVNGELVKTMPAVSVAATDADLVLGGASPEALTAGTWNIFTQFHATKTGDGLDCIQEGGGVPISFNVRYREANSYKNPGATETATPVDGDYLEIMFEGGELNEDCTDTVNPTQRYVLGLLKRGHWYDFVLHTRWTQLPGQTGDSISEVWVDGKQLLGDQSTPVTTPNLVWHGTTDVHNNQTFLKWGMYRGPSMEDPKNKLYIDAFRRGLSYGEVAPGQ